METQPLISYIAFALLILGYSFLFAVWVFTKTHLTKLIGSVIFSFIVYVGYIKSVDFWNGLNLFDRYLPVHLGFMFLIYCIMVGYRFHREITYAWRISHLRNLFKWERCSLPFNLMRKLVEARKHKSR